MTTRVRPSIRRAARLALPLAIAIEGWQVWDNVEVRRFEAEVAAFHRSGRPHGETTQPAGVENGARYYAAAALLTDTPATFPAAQTVTAVRTAVLSGRPVDAAVATVSADTLRRNVDALAMVDRAAALRITTVDVPDPTVFVLRSVPVWMHVAPVLSLRTLERAGRGDGDGAVASLVSEARFLRGATADPATLAATQQALVVRSIVADVSVVLRRSAPSEPELQMLDEALAEAIAPDDLERLVAGQSEFRFRNIGAYDRTAWSWVVRPAIRRLATRMVGTSMEALDVSRRPWPDRVRGMSRLRGWSQPPLLPGALRFLDGDRVRDLYERLAADFAAGVAGISVARTTIALERYRRTTGSYPDRLDVLAMSGAATLDPFTGHALRYARQGAGYVVYSVGRDGRDDGGDVGELAVSNPPGAKEARDLGIRLPG